MQIKLLAVFAFVLLALVILLVRITYIITTKGNTYAKQVLSQQSYDSQTISTAAARSLTGTVLFSPNPTGCIILSWTAEP